MVQEVLADLKRHQKNWNQKKCQKTESWYLSPTQPVLAGWRKSGGAKQAATYIGRYSSQIFHSHLHHPLRTKYGRAQKMRKEGTFVFWKKAHNRDKTRFADRLLSYIDHQDQHHRQFHRHHQKHQQMRINYCRNSSRNCVLATKVVLFHLQSPLFCLREKGIFGVCPRLKLAFYAPSAHKWDRSVSNEGRQLTDSDIPDTSNYLFQTLVLIWMVFVLFSHFKYVSEARRFLSYYTWWFIYFSQGNFIITVQMFVSTLTSYFGKHGEGVLYTRRGEEENGC